MTNADSWRLEWNESSEALVNSTEALDRLLDELTDLARAKPFMAELTSPAGDSLALGLGREQSVLSWVPANQEPPYFASKGDPEAPGTIVFFYRGHWSESPCWSAIPIADARQAMRDFFLAGYLPSGPAWEEV